MELKFYKDSDRTFLSTDGTLITVTKTGVRREKLSALDKPEYLLELARKIAQKAHKKQKDLAGNDYFEHLERVASSVTSDELKIVAFLHDILEDTKFIALEELKEIFGEEISEAIFAITKQTDEDYSDYLLRVKENKLARLVKLADLEDNSKESRLSKLDIDKAKKLSDKYKVAKSFLEDNLKLKGVE